MTSAKVFVVLESTPWEGSEVKGVFSSLNAAHNSIPKQFILQPEEKPDYTYREIGDDGHIDFYEIKEFKLQ